MNWIPFFIIALDQITKRIALYLYEKGIYYDYLFCNTYIWNSGICFNFLEKSEYKMLVYALVISSVGMIIYYYFNSKGSEKIYLGLIVGGGISNLLDRLCFGAVLDFLMISGKTNFPIFNIADVAVVLGSLLICINNIKIKK